MTLSGWLGVLLGLLRMFAAGRYQQAVADTNATVFVILEGVLCACGLVMTFKVSEVKSFSPSADFG